ncbi:MAG: hypothetical protein QJR03_16215 [Sphaerobacter sp.]|nr:hypothetical protein [Sphaerobacter sp.]
MFAGHFGLAAAVKGREPRVPLWALLLSTQLLDVVFVVLVIAGVESIAGRGYGKAVIHAEYTHSLVGALVIALVAGLLAGRAWGRRAAVVIGAVVFSHWVLDLIVHHPDLPILPGNLGGLPLLGFGLWSYPAVSITLEALIISIGAVLYARSALVDPGHADARHERTTRAVIAAAIMAVFLVATLVTDVVGI